jgi:hypothetical protein
MSSHHDHHDQHSEEAKPVAFRTPMILGLVTLLAIVLLVSTCDKKHGCCEDESKCEGQAKHHGGEATEEHNEKDVIEKMEETVPVVTDTIAKADTAHVVEHAAEHAAH